MEIVLGLAAAVAYGTGDFLGALGTRRSSAPTMVLASRAVALVVLVPAMLLFGGSATLCGTIAGSVAGVLEAGALVMLFTGLGRGRVSMVAPVAAVGAAAVPFLAGVLAGERPGPLATTGALVAVIAVAVMAARGGQAPTTNTFDRRLEVLVGVGAGVAFGLVLALLGSTSSSSGLWPVALSQVSCLLVLAAGTSVTRRSLAMPASAVPLAAATGALDACGLIAYVAAARGGMVSLVAVLGSLYPAITVLLGRLLNRERLPRSHTAAFLVTAAGVAMIAAR